MDRIAVKDLISKYNLISHPEGGHYKETYRTQHSTAIFYLLTKGQKSSLHRIQSDEMWHFYGGDSLMIVEVTNEGLIKETLLDKNNVQYCVPANVWFGAYLPDKSEFAFTGCTVAPPFNFTQFEMGNKEKMMQMFPQAKSMIEKLLS